MQYADLDITWPSRKGSNLMDLRPGMSVCLSVCLSGFKRFHNYANRIILLFGKYNNDICINEVRLLRDIRRVSDGYNDRLIDVQCSMTVQRDKVIVGLIPLLALNIVDLLKM